MFSAPPVKPRLFGQRRRTSATVLRFLKLIVCDNVKIGTYAKLVDDRNDTVHPNGNIFFSTQDALDTKTTEVLRVADEIQAHSKPIIERCYREFLLRSHDPEEREYPTAADQIREILIHGHYLSHKDVEICAGFDLDSLADEAPSEPMCELHATLIAGYGRDDENGAP